MDSPVRKQLKRNDYLRHKMFRKIKRRRKAEQLLAIDAPAKELRRRLRRRTFKCGKDAYRGGKDDDDIIFGEVPYPLYDQYGNLLDLNTGAIGTTALPNVEVVANPEDVARGNDRRAEEMAKQWYKDFGIESNDVTSTPLTTNHHLKQRSEEGAAKAAAWAKDHPYLNMTGLAAGAVPFAVAAYPGAVVGGELLGTALANPYVDAGLTSVFAAHGLNHWLNEGITDWKDGVMTALEVTPLGRLARPIWNAVKPTRNFVPTLESNMSGVRYAYNRNPELAKIGSLEDYNNYLKTVFPESKVKDINYHMGPKGLQELKPSTGEVYNTNPDARGIYVTPDKSYAQRLRKYTTDRLEKPSFFTYLKRNLIPNEWDKVNDVFTDIYPVVVDTKNPLLTKGSWTWGIKDKKYQSLMHDYDAIVNSGPKWYQNFNSMPEIIVPKTEQSLILGSDADVAGFRRFMSDLQTTGENAASEMSNIVRTVGDNGKIRLSLPSHTNDRPRQFVLEPQGNNKFYVHMRTWDGDHIPANLTNEEKQQLFDALYNELPEGAEILFPKSGPGYYGTRGTVAGLQRLARDPRFTPGTRGTLQYLDKDGKTVRIYEGTSFIKIPQITAENAASITPEQWTAAQDAAIARGDMAEAQRLRDLHFQVSAPNTVALVNGQPLQLYHGTDATFNAFDISKYGNTDGGTFGRGLYTTPVKEYAELYGKNNMPLYMKLDNPRDYRNSSIGDLIAEKIAFGDDFATGIGIDGVIGRPSWKGFKGLEEYVSHNPKNIKSSLPITYDDNGVRIPLGMRDNFKINDIRYGLLPFLGLGIAENLNKSHYASGKDSGIHIKPENRGKFTRLKKRTGKSASWFKAHGTPAQKKMATFALNARKWKHK